MHLFPGPNESGHVSSKRGLPSWSRYDFDTEKPTESVIRNGSRRNGILSTNSHNTYPVFQQTFQSASPSYHHKSLYQSNTKARGSSSQISSTPTCSLNKSQCLETQPVTMHKASKLPQATLKEQSSICHKDQDDDCLLSYTDNSAKEKNDLKTITSSLVALFKKPREKPKQRQYSRQISTQLASICEETLESYDNYGNSMADAFKSRVRPGESIVIAMSSLEEELAQQGNKTKKRSVYTLEEFLKLP